VHGVAGYYLNKEGKYYDGRRTGGLDVLLETASKPRRALFDKIIGSEPEDQADALRLRRAAVLHRELFECVPFDPMVPRGEDVDYLINGGCTDSASFWITPSSISICGAEVPPAVDALSRGYLPFCLPAGENDGARRRRQHVLVHPEQFDPYGRVSEE
jgi:hypothetical protein